MEWEVWLADGTTRDSRTCSWMDVPDGVLVVRYWGPKGKGINWGDGLYGDPSTIKQAGWVSDEEFAAVLARAKEQTTLPSKR